MVVAIDGPAGAGKSTVARGVAGILGFIYLDTGAMYRSVALATMRAGVDPHDAEAVTELAAGLDIRLVGSGVLLGGEDVSAAIRTPDVTEVASLISAHPGVRKRMVERQRDLINNGRYVAEGRDIGTVVSPDSPLKVFLVASDDERAKRRAMQTGEDPAAVLVAQSERDRRDRERDHGALRPAEDAVEVDTTGLGVDEVVARVVELARERGLA
jgi:CMP/dCMP kinase